MTNERALDAAIRRFHRLIGLCRDKDKLAWFLVVRAEYRDMLTAEYRRVLTKESA